MEWRRLVKGDRSRKRGGGGGAGGREKKKSCPTMFGIDVRINPTSAKAVTTQSDNTNASPRLRGNDDLFADWPAGCRLGPAGRPDGG